MLAYAGLPTLEGFLLSRKSTRFFADASPILYLVRSAAHYLEKGTVIGQRFFFKNIEPCKSDRNYPLPPCYTPSTYHYVINPEGTGYQHCD
jgi:hypothetical protein